MQLICDEFQRDARWPVFHSLDRALYRRFDLDLPTLLSELRPQFVLFDPNGHPATDVMLTVPGLAECHGTEQDLDLLVRAVQWCVKREREHESGTQDTDGSMGVTGAELADGLANEGARFDSAALARARAMLILEGVASGGGVSNPDHADGWHINLDRRVRRFVGVHTLDDLVRVVWRAAPATPGAASVGVAANLVTDALRARMAFVLMPFEHGWSEDVYAAMRRASARVGEAGRLTCLRADEMTRTGNITEQIIEAIREADVLIADVTGSNPNVMYELGYADALGKPVVLLNQDVGSAPFDIKVMRQINYAPSDLGALEDRLEAFLRTSLEEPDARWVKAAPIASVDRESPTPPCLLRPSTQHATGAFNMPQYRGLNCWLVNDGPSTVKVDRAVLHHRSAALDGHFRSQDGDEVDALLVPAREELWIEFPPSAELAAVRSDRDSQLELDVRYRDPLEPQRWWVTLVLRRALDDGSRAKWTAVDQGDPRLDSEGAIPA